MGFQVQSNTIGRTVCLLYLQLQQKTSVWFRPYGVAHEHPHGVTFEQPISFAHKQPDGVTYEQPKCVAHEQSISFTNEQHPDDSEHHCDSHFIADDCEPHCIANSESDCFALKQPKCFTIEQSNCVTFGNPNRFTDDG